MSADNYATIRAGIAAGIRIHAFLSLGHDDATTPVEYDAKLYEWARVALSVLSSVEEWIGHPYGSAGEYREFLADCGIHDRVIVDLNLSEEDPLAYY